MWPWFLAINAWISEEQTSPDRNRHGKTSTHIYKRRPRQKGTRGERRTGTSRHVSITFMHYIRKALEDGTFVKAK